MKKKSNIKYKDFKYILKNKLQIVKEKFSVTIFLCLSFLLLLQVFLTINVINKSMTKTFSYFVTNKSTEIVIKNEKIIEDARLVLANLAQDIEIRKFWGNDDIDSVKIKTSFQNYKNYLYSIEEMYVYRSENNTFLTSENGFSELNFDVIEEKAVKDIIAKRPDNNSFGMLLGYKGFGYVYNLYTVYYPFNNSQDAVILRFSFDEFVKNMNTFDFDDSMVCILNSDSSMFFSTHASEKTRNVQDLLGDFYYKEDGIYEIKNSLEDFVLLKKSSQIMNKAYIFVCSKDKAYISDNINVIILFTSVLFVVILGFVFVFFFLNKKFQQHMKNNHEKALHSTFKGKRDYVVREYINSHGETDDKRLEMIDFKFEKAEPVKVLIIFIDDYENFCSKHPNLKDRELFKYGMQNILCEILEKNGIKSESTTLEADKTMLLVDGNVTNYEIKNAITESKHHIKNVLELEFTAAIGKTIYVDSITEVLPSLYEMAKYRYVYGDNAILIQELILNKIGSTFSKNFDEMVIELKEYLIKENYEDSVKLFSDIKTVVKDSGFDKIKLRLSLLSDTLCQIYENICKEKNYKNSFNAIDIIEKIMSSKNFDTAFGICEELLKEILDLSDNNSSDKSEKICNSIIKIIDENYPNVEFSINEVAKELNLSINHLNKIFKERYNESIPKYILSVRIENGKRLLRETNYTVREVSQMVGMNTPSHFGALFKKYENMTPNEYRMLKK